MSTNTGSPNHCLQFKLPNIPFPFCHVQLLRIESNRMLFILLIHLAENSAKGNMRCVCSKSPLSSSHRKLQHRPCEQRSLECFERLIVLRCPSVVSPNRL